MFRLLKIHTGPVDSQGSSWLQLFFDLVYVAILVQLGHRLSGNLTLEGAFEFVFLFIPIWLSWLEFVSYGRYFPIDDIGQRLLTIIYMAMMLIMAFEIYDVTGETASAFIASYGLSKFVIAVMYARAWRQFPEYGSMTIHHAAAYIIIGSIWIVIAFLAPSNYWLWGLATLIAITAPPLLRLIRDSKGHAAVSHPATKYHYVQHRFGELTIIVLGEFFIKLVTSSGDTTLTLFNLYFGLCLLGISIAFWWLYFDHLEHFTLSKVGSRLGIWIYSHFPFWAALTAYGVAGTKVFFADRVEPLSDPERLLFTISLAAALLAIAGIDLATKERDESLSRKTQPWLRIGGAAALLLLALLGASLNTGILLTIVVLILLIQLAGDVYQRIRRPESQIVDPFSPA